MASGRLCGAGAAAGRAIIEHQVGLTDVGGHVAMEAGPRDRPQPEPGAGSADAPEDRAESADADPAAPNPAGVTTRDRTEDHPDGGTAGQGDADRLDAFTESLDLDTIDDIEAMGDLQAIDGAVGGFGGDLSPGLGELGDLAGLGDLSELPELGGLGGLDDGPEPSDGGQSFRELRPQRRLRIWQLAPIVALAVVGSLMFAFPLAFETGDGGAMVAMLGLLLGCCAAGWGVMAARRVGYTWPGLPPRGSGRRLDWRFVLLYVGVIAVPAVLAVWRVARLR
jgi:hypothetical protein